MMQLISVGSTSNRSTQSNPWLIDEAGQWPSFNHLQEKRKLEALIMGFRMKIDDIQLIEKYDEWFGIKKQRFGEIKQNEN